MKLYLCEKPSQGNDLAKVLGATKRGNGCLSTNDDQIFVTWCIGHLVEQFSPEQYNPELKKWAFETLPIIPSNWQVAPKKETKKQYNIVISLIKKASQITIATDADREGETIARELLTLANYRGYIERLWLTGLDTASIQHALKNVKKNEETVRMYHAGVARSRADWLVGMNFSRLFTLLAQQKGYHGSPLSVGRVQSPTIAIVVKRDREIAQFKPKNHFTLTVELYSPLNQLFLAQYQIPEQYCDENGLCLNQNIIGQVNQQIRQYGQAKVVSVETKREKENPPLLFALSDLQGECNRIYGMGAQQVLDIAQSLYETHKATTYPRTDCGYLPESQFTEVRNVLQNLVKSDTTLQKIIPHLNLDRKSRAWNDKKITAHHGIIPTTSAVNLSKMSNDEMKVYDLIRRRYLAQFLPVAETDKTVINLDVAGHSLVSKGKIMVAPGWKILFGKTLEQDDNSNEQQNLPVLKENDLCSVRESKINSLQTSPPNHYTEGTLLSAMKNAARFVTDERLKQRLRETEGLGTEATRAALIQGLFNKGFLKKKGKSVIATEQAITLIDNLPVLLKDPGLTALWEQALNQIESGQLTLDSFMEKQKVFIQTLMKDCLRQGINLGKIEIKKCPKCGSPMIKRKSKNGEFWGCSKYPNCNGIENVGRNKKSPTTKRKILN